MESSKEEGKRIIEVPELDEEDEDFGEDSKRVVRALLTPSKSRRLPSAGGGSTQRNCQVEDCTADMSGAKQYHRRHKVCEFHAKSAVVLLTGLRQRFCQQCSRFDSGFMSYQSSMKLKEVAAGVWQDTMSDVARAYTILIEQRRDVDWRK